MRRQVPLPDNACAAMLTLLHVLTMQTVSIPVTVVAKFKLEILNMLICMCSDVMYMDTLATQPCWIIDT